MNSNSHNDYTRINANNKRIDARSIALDIVFVISEKGGYTNLVLDKMMRNLHLAAHDKHLITEIVNGTIRMLKHLDWVLNLFLKTPLEKQNPWLRNILRISLYQILFMDKIPLYAAVDSAVNLTRIKSGPKLTSVCNGVLRNIIRNRNQINYPSRERLLEYLSVYYSHPEWLVKKWLEQFGAAETERILAYNNKPPQLSLRCNQLKGTREDLVARLEKENVKCHISSFAPWLVLIDSIDKSISKLEAFQDGWFYIQNAASMLAAPILDAQPGQLVYDLCCGVGGKCTHIAEYMNNTGEIAAFDIYEQKLKLLVYNCSRLGIKIINGNQRDILSLPDHMVQASRVLLDAPCSGLGVLNRRPDARWKKNLYEVNKLIELQDRMLDKAAALVEDKGLLVYSTCTINNEENEEVVNRFLQDNHDFNLEGFKDRLSFLSLPAEEQKQVSAGMITIKPGAYCTDGMFYACMRRK